MANIPLGDLCDFINGGAWSESEYVESGIPVLKVSNIKPSGFQLSDISYLSHDSLCKYAQNILLEDDVVIATVGSHPTSPESAAGRSCRVTKDIVGYLLNQNAVCIRTKNQNILNQKYLSYISESREFRHYIQSRGKGAANQMRIAISSIKEYNVQLPPLHIQRRIADILSAYDDLIENNQRQIKLLEEAAMRLYREWFVFMRFPGHESVRIVDGVPEGWDTRLLPDCVDYMRGISYSAKDIEGTDGVYLLNLKNVKEYGGYNFSEDAVKSYSGTYKEEDVVKCGDLIMAVTDMTPECRIVGSVALVPPLDNIAVISMDLMKLIPREISTIYLYHTFRFGNISHLLSRRANGTNVLHLKTETMEDVSILLPTDDLVEQYEMLVLPMQETIELYEKQNRSLVLARDALLPRLMNGGVGLKLEGGTV